MHAGKGAALLPILLAACAPEAEPAPPPVTQGEQRALAEAHAMIPAEERAAPSEPAEQSRR
ncbi:hypothetical protein [Qipengyuania sediminis]|uniref:hypothetical protein n=1 Tax=Qipengyuania sediminis TaxID=1532023 RepID=UPI00105AA948|nr:hypothetical protein [Qipengyuania sediminis]